MIASIFGHRPLVSAQTSPLGSCRLINQASVIDRLHIRFVITPSSWDLDLPPIVVLAVRGVELSAHARGGRFDAG